MNVFELNVVKQELNSFFSSNYIETKIKDVFKFSFSEFNQRLLLGVQDIAHSAVEDFKNSLTKELRDASNNWISSQNMLQIVPTGTRYLGKKGNGKICVVEYSPTLKTLNFDIDSDMISDGGVFRLAFPYVIFIVKLIPSWSHENCFLVEKVYIGYRTKPLQNLNDKIYCANLPNCDIDHHICLGTAWDKVSDELRKSKDSSLSSVVESVIGYFWNSEFNDDLMESFNRCSVRNNKIKNLKTWQENSIKDPLFVLNLDWGVGMPISDFLDDNYEFRLNVGAIADRAIIEAGQKLNKYLKTAMQVTISKQKSFDIMKKALYESLITTCGRVLDSSKAKNN